MNYLIMFQFFSLWYQGRKHGVDFHHSTRNASKFWLQENGKTCILTLISAYPVLPGKQREAKKTEQARVGHAYQGFRIKIGGFELFQKFKLRLARALLSNISLELAALTY